MENMWGIPKNPLCSRAKLWWAEFKSYDENKQIIKSKYEQYIMTKYSYIYKSELGQ